MGGAGRAWAVGLLVAGFGGLLALFWDFTADDAYIPVRYADHLVDDFELTYNLGERVAAFTSPLHTFLLAGFELVFGSSLVANKALSAAAVLAAALVGARALRHDPYGAVVVAGAVLLSPFVAVWAVGGLETSYLLLVITLLVVLSRDPDALGARRIALLALLVGVAFLVRHDSILFTAPLLLWLAWRQRRSIRGLALLAPAGVALAWLGFSLAYYDDLLPTTYYVKQPSAAGGLLRPGLYEIQFAVLSGLGLVLALALWSLRHPSARGAARDWLVERRGWVVAGLVAVAGYGLLAGMQHMMFSYRLFVPYLPAAVLVALELRARAREAQGAGPSTLRTAAGVLLPLAAVNAAVAVSIYSVGLNPSLVGEYRHESLRSYTNTFIPAMGAQSDEIEADWRERAQARPVRVLTFLAGIVPQHVPDAYILESLVSYRHGCGLDDFALSADYVHTPADFLRESTYSELVRRRQIEPVSSRTIEFDGKPMRVIVARLVEPRPLLPPKTIDGRC